MRDSLTLLSGPRSGLQPLESCRRAAVRHKVVWTIIVRPINLPAGHHREPRRPLNESRAQFTPARLALYVAILVAAIGLFLLINACGSTLAAPDPVASTTRTAA